MGGASRGSKVGTEADTYGWQQNRRETPSGGYELVEVLKGADNSGCQPLQEVGAPLAPSVSARLHCPHRPPCCTNHRHIAVVHLVTLGRIHPIYRLGRSVWPVDGRDELGARSMLSSRGRRLALCPQPVGGLDALGMGFSAAQPKPRPHLR